MHLKKKKDPKSFLFCFLLLLTSDVSELPGAAIEPRLEPGRSKLPFNAPPFIPIRDPCAPRSTACVPAALPLGAARLALPGRGIEVIGVGVKEASDDTRGGPAPACGEDEGV